VTGARGILERQGQRVVEAYGSNAPIDGGLGRVTYA
jgi:hypothetical protein